MSRSLARYAIATAVLLAGCDDASGPAGPGPAATVQLVAGNGQSATAGEALPAALVARILDADGKPVAAQRVEFRVVSGGGSVAAEAAQTDAAGDARARWTLGRAAADSQRVELRAVNASSGAVLAAATFAADAVPGAPSVAAPVGTVARAGEAGATLGDPLTVRVTDRLGNGVPGVALTWRVASGGGVVAPAGAATDSTGIASAQWTLGARVDSVQVAQATVAGLGSLIFAARPSVPGSAVLVKISGDAQTGAPTAQLAEPLTVEARLADGRVLAGASVVWSVTGGGSITPVPVAEVGRAAVRWRQGTRAGDGGRVSATLGASVVTFSSTTRSGPPARVRFDADSVVLASLNAEAQLAASVSDAWGNPTADAVTYALLEADVVELIPTARVRAQNNGVARVVARSGAAADTARAIVRQAPARIALSPDPATILVNGSTLLAAYVTDAGGSEIRAPALTWSSSAPGVAEPSTAGLRAGLASVAGRARGTATVTASGGVVSAMATVRVVSAPASIRMEPAALTLHPGESARITATPLDADGNPVSGFEILWASSGRGIASVVDGNVTARFAGTVTITAYLRDVSGVSGETVVQVVP